MKKWWRDHWQWVSVCCASITLIWVGVILGRIDFLQNQTHMISYFGFSLTFISIIVLVIQHSRAHDWNRRLAAINAMLTFKEKVKPFSEIIHQEFGYVTRAETDTIKVPEIHDKICEKNGDSYVHDKSTGKHKLDLSKKTIHDAINEMLNLYEHIASAVYQGVYDRDIVIDLMGSNVIKAATVFSEYIEHVNTDMYPKRNGKIWANIKSLGEEFKTELRPPQAKTNRKQT